MFGSTIQWMSALTVVLFVAVLIRMVRARMLRAKYSIFWLGVGSLVLAIAVVPGLLGWLSDTANVVYPPSLLFAAAIMLLMFVTLHFSWELSRLEERTRTLAEEIALLMTEFDRSRTASPPATPDDEEKTAPQPKREEQRK